MIDNYRVDIAVIGSPIEHDRKFGIDTLQAGVSYATHQGCDQSVDAGGHKRIGATDRDAISAAHSYSVDTGNGDRARRDGKDRSISRSGDDAVDAIDRQRVVRAADGDAVGMRDVPRVGAADGNSV